MHSLIAGSIPHLGVFTQPRPVTFRKARSTWRADCGLKAAQHGTCRIESKRPFGRLAAFSGPHRRGGGIATRATSNCTRRACSAGISAVNILSNWASVAGQQLINQSRKDGSVATAARSFEERLTAVPIGRLRSSRGKVTDLQISAACSPSISLSNSRNAHLIRHFGTQTEQCRAR